VVLCTMQRPKFSALLASVSLLTGMAVVAAPPAGAAGTWSVIATPAPAGATASFLGAVACPAATSCFAVGGHTNGGSTFANAMHWNGTAWSIEAIPKPAGSTYSELNGVACPTTTSCFAVGGYTSPSGRNLFAVHWNGSAWSIRTTARPAGATGAGFDGIACPAPASCFAVGDYSSSTVTTALVQHWNGTAWTTQPKPNPSGSTSSTLYGVACPTTTSCFAAGDWFKSPVTKTLVEHWNGSAWGIQASPNPAGSTYASFSGGISCPGPNNCFAAGISSANTGGTKGLIAHWNGSVWAGQPSVNPGHSPTLSAVACLSTTSCFAVGFFDTTASLIEHWDGSIWTRMTSPHPGSFYNDFLGVACRTGMVCMAVGLYAGGNSRSLAARYH
jgi:hypothetical protein